jgi:phosphoenolpyruvate carboxykinase (ATP)
VAVSSNFGHLPIAKSVFENPSGEEFAFLTGMMSNASLTSFGSFNVQTRVDARSASSTYIISDSPRHDGGQTVSRSEAKRLADIQDSYIKEQEMVLVSGAICSSGELVTPSCLYIEKRNANIAGMQRKLYFRPGETSEPIEFSIIYTPNLAVPGYPNERCILVDLDSGITRVMNSDYFGESKKGGLRMWNHKVFNMGGLALHAGCKVIPVDGKEKVFLIVGLSGTGKTTTTFTDQNESLPVQDDFVALLPGGRVAATEQGCFAKTYRLTPKYEPAIYKAVTLPTTYLENVSQDMSGKVDFADDHYTQNGRAVFGLEDLGGWRDAEEIGSVDAMLILNRNENLIPAVARLTREQAAAYFMLGETQGTSAGGKDEMGKFLRVPGTNPFFPMAHELQGNRFLELWDSHPFDVYLMNTGRVGGPENDPRSLKISVLDSSAIVKGIAEGTIVWASDPDFGYEVAEGVPGIGEPELLRPGLLYERQGRLDEYEAAVRRLKQERLTGLEAYPNLNPDIRSAIQ